ncbi:hypothetical protein EDB83DRAFT_2320272 [Lactarius deliciosus]|nr:hypothetical protein EDB83DRAFT_2320272 [Lactarius deliciosus]
MSVSQAGHDRGVYSYGSSGKACNLMSIHSALDDFCSEAQRKVDFSADWYEDVYKTHMEFLSHIQEGSITKYHQLMAGLYTQLFTTTTGASSVANEVIAQLDFAAMVE